MKHFFMRSPSVWIAASLLLTGCGIGGSNSDPVDADIRIGALVDLSGDNSASGSQLENAILQAASDAKTLGVIVGVEVRDTQSDPAIAVQQLNELLALGVRVFVGPSTSSEAAAVLPVANAAGALLVSESSTAQSLAIPNDALYRLSPTNIVEAQTSVDLIRLRGQRSLITVNRDDLGNNETASAVRQAAAAAGLSLQAPIRYPASDQTDFNAIASVVAEQVAAAAPSGDTSPVGIYVSGFDEVEYLFADMRANVALTGIATYGSSAIATADYVVSSAGPAFFGVYNKAIPSPLLEIPAEQLSQAEQITDEIGGTTPNAFTLNAYDAVILMAQAYLLNPDFGAGGAGARQSFVQAADGYTGLTGTIELNAAGDRASGYYSYWGVCSVQGFINWHIVGSWTPVSPNATRGTARFVGCPAQ